MNVMGMLESIQEYPVTAPALRLTPDEQLWLRQKWRRIRQSQHAADLGTNEWAAINKALNDKLDAEGVRDIVQRTKVKGASIALKDALETGKWHSAEATRHIQDVQLFLRLKELGLLPLKVEAS